MENKKSSCKERHENKTGCCGDCWINVAGSFSVYEVISKHCQGTSEEREMIGEMFHQKRDRKELFDEYNLSDKEKKIIEGSWF